MSRRLLLTPAAKQDLRDIWRYLSQQNEAAADRLLDRLERRMEELRNYPELGPSREEVQPRLRHLLAAPYLILYQLEEGVVVVGRVIDGRRDLSGL